ncbi:MAG: mercuric transport protein [Xanthomonadaceae bacterium]|nr:mercuric transport protein [Xanthomonadaceae bacterium]
MNQPSIQNEPSTQPELDQSSAGLLALGGFGAVLLSACCVLPLVLVMLGLGGAWLANLHALYAYRWLFFGLSVIVLFFAWRRLYRPATACADGEVCAVPTIKRGYRVLFWVVTALVALSAVAPYVLGALMV